MEFVFFLFSTNHYSTSFEWNCNEAGENDAKNGPPLVQRFLQSEGRERERVPVTISTGQSTSIKQKGTR